MANALLISLGGGLLLQSQGISLLHNAGDSSSDHLGSGEDPSLVGSDCRDPAVDDKCFMAVKWALEKGVHDHPEWYPAFRGAGLTEENFREMQLVLHNDGKAGCGKPCPPFFTPYATLGETGHRRRPGDIDQNEDVGEAQETETKPPVDDEIKNDEIKKEMEDINGPHGGIGDMSMDSFKEFLNDPKWRDAMAATIITTTVEETTSLFEEAVPENTSNATAEEAQLNSTEAAASEREVTVQDQVNTLKAELEALESMESSPLTDAMRQEKRDQLQSLQATLPAEEAPAATEPIEEGAPAPAGEEQVAAPAAEDSQNATAEDSQNATAEDSQNDTAEDPGCHTSVEGDACYEEVMYSKQTGVVKHPDKYAGLTPDSPFEDFQRHVHFISSICPHPCARKNPPSPAAAQPSDTEPTSTDSQSTAAVTPAAEQPRGNKGWFSRFRRGAKEAKKEPAAADEPAAEVAQKFGELGRVTQKLDAQGEAAEMEAEVNTKEAEMMAQEAQARVNGMEEEAQMRAQVARQQAKEEAQMEEARMEEARMEAMEARMMSEKAEAQKESHEDA